MRKLALCILTLPNGWYILQRRGMDAKFSPDLLGLFGGHIEDGEMPYDAMCRELTEETSLKVKELNIQPGADYEMPNADVHVYLYAASIDEATFEVYEGVGAEVYSLDELQKRNDTADILMPLLQKSL